MPRRVPDDDLPDDLRRKPVPFYDLPDDLQQPVFEELELQNQARGPGEPHRGRIPRKNLAAATPETDLSSMPGMRRPDSMWDNPSMEVVGEKLADAVPSAIAGTKTGVKSVPGATRQMTSGVNMMLNAKAPERIEQMARESYEQNIRDGVPQAQAQRTLDRAMAWAQREREGVIESAKKNLAAGKEVAALQNPNADRVEQAFAQGIPSAVQSAAVGLPAALLSGGNPVVTGGAVAAVLGTGTAGQRYAELIAAGVPDDKARRSAALLGTLEGLTEAIPGGTLVKRNKAMLKRGLDFLMQDLVGENISTTAQMVDDYANGLRDDLTWDDWVEAVKQTTAATVVAGGAQVGAQQLLETTIQKANELRGTKKPMPRQNLWATTEREFGPAPSETQLPNEPGIAPNPAQEPQNPNTPRRRENTVPGAATAPIEPSEAGYTENLGGSAPAEAQHDSTQNDPEALQIQPDPATPEGAYVADLIQTMGQDGARAYQQKLREMMGSSVRRNAAGLDLDKIDQILGLESPVAPGPIADAVEPTKRRVALPDEDPEKYAPAERPGEEYSAGDVTFRDLGDGAFTATSDKDGTILASLELGGEETTAEGDYAKSVLQSLREYADARAPRETTVDKSVDNLATSKVAGHEITVNTKPSQAQIEAGNYKKGHITFQGLPVTIETPIGAIRSGQDENGKKWSRTMEADYGYVKGSEGADGDHVDIFLGKDVNPQAENAYVVDQLTKDGKAFDEHKVILGANSEAEAEGIYRAHYPKNWKGMGAITPITMDRFKTWLGKGVRKEPIAWVPQTARDSRKVQVQHDSLLEAIAKTKLHGAQSAGLSISALEKEGLDPADMRALRGMGITRPFSSKGAASLDQMAERLHELGYPVTDQDGNYSANKLLELISQEMRGERVYSEHKEHDTDEDRRAAQVDSFMATYQPPEDVFGIPDDKLDHYIAMLQAVQDSRGEEGGEPGTGVMFSREKQADLFGDPVAIKNELQRLMAEKDRRRNTGQESPETGRPDDLFSQAQRQTDLTDAASIESKMEALAERVRQRMEQVTGQPQEKVPDITDWTSDERAELHALKGKLPSYGEQREAAEERIRRKVANRREADAARAAKAALVKQFIGRDDAFWNIEPGTNDGATFRDNGMSATVCTGYACQILKKLGKDRVKVMGFSEDNGHSRIVKEDGTGHDFAIVDDRFIVDPWLPEFSSVATKEGVFDLERDADKVKDLYGEKVFWEDATQHWVDVMDKLQKAATPKARTATSTPKPATGLVDAGEKIGGARKDLWASRGMNLSDLENISDTEAAHLVTKAAVWKPDYAAAVEGGLPAETVAGIKVLWDKLAARPTENTPDGRRHYVMGLSAVKKALSAARTEEDLKDIQDKVAAELNFSWRGDRLSRTESEGYKAFWSIMKGRRSTLGWGFDERRSVKKLIDAGFPNAEPWTRIYKITFEYGKGLTDNGVEVYVRRASEAGTPLDPATIRAGFFVVRKKDGAAVGYAHTKEGAEAIAKDRYSGPSAEKAKDAMPERPHLDTVKRVGKAVRTRDAVPDDFLKDFGFRGIEFGNWAANDERQKLVNLAYDALQDLAMVMNIPPEALSLDGRMGLALGARGVGRAAAHYEPGKLVINMTKINGAGSLAHEWGHAFDHYLGELDREDAYKTMPRGVTGWYNMPRLNTQSNLRPEMQKAFRALLAVMFKRDRTKAEAVRDAELQLEKAQGTIEGERKRLEKAKTAGTPDPTFIRRLTQWIDDYERVITVRQKKLAEMREMAETADFGKVQTSYAHEASKLSGKTDLEGKLGYWQRPTEMFARAFESYVFDKLRGRELASEYLVHGVEGERYARGYKGNPYPVGPEREAINSAFDSIFATMKTRGGEKSLALYHTEEPITASQFGDQLAEEFGIQVRLLENKGDIKIDRLIVDQGRRGSGVGTQVMNRITDFADERESRLILNVASRGEGIGTTSAGRLVEFYKRFGFYENRGRRKDFTIRERMIRQPQVVQKTRVKVKDNRATYTIEDRKKTSQQPPSTSQMDIFAAADNPAPARKVMALESRVALVQTGEFKSGIKTVKSLEDAAHILAPFRKAAQENMMALVTTIGGKPLGVIRHTVGLIDSASVEPWSLVGSITSMPGAAKVYFAHNHPSGFLNPSSADELITQRLASMLKDTGIKSQGMFIFGAGHKTATHFTTWDRSAVNIKPMPRHGKVPLLERNYVRIPNQSAQRGKIESEREALKYIESLGKRTGLILLDNRHYINGFFEMSNEEMSTLRTGDPETGAGKVMSILHQANASAVVPVGTAESTANMNTFLEDIGVRMLDRYFPNGEGHMGSAYARGIYNDKGTYTHRAREAVLVDGPISLPEVMVDSTPTQDMAENFTRLQMGHYVQQKGQTAHLAGTVYLPVKMLEGLSETRPHARPQDQGNIDAIARSIEVNGFDQRHPILLTVDANGIASIFDGNHRIQAASQAGIQEVPTRVVYLNGGETKDWKFSPQKLGAAAMANASRADNAPISRQGQVQTAVDRSMAQFKDRPPVTVVQTFDSLPKAARERVGGDRAKRGGVNAFIDFTAAGAHIYLVADRFHSDQHVAEVLMHEMTHYGLESVLSDQEWNDISHGILRDQKDRVAAIIKHEPRTLDMKNPKHQALVVHEVLAYMNQKRQSGKPFDQVEEKLWNRVMRAIRAFLKRIGLTGPAYTDEYVADLLDAMTAKMRSPRIQAAKGDIPGFVNLEPLANRTAPPFYSAVARTVQESKQAKASAQQWWSTLNNTKGVKPEELEWLGVQDWLKAQDGPITREQLAEYIAANQIDIQDVVKGGKGTANRLDQIVVELSALGYQLDRDMDGTVSGVERIDGTANYPYDYDDETFLDDEGNSPPQEVIDLAMEYGRSYDENDPDQGGPKYAQYTLPGGENYREVLLTLAFEPPVIAALRKRKTELLDKAQRTPLSAAEEEELKKLFAELATRMDPYTGAGDKYVSGHWNEPNVVAHVRLKDRTDKDGKKVLFVEEIQSDWHQAGRKRGYKGHLDTSGWKAEKAGNEWTVFNARGDVLRSIPILEHNKGDLRNEQDAIAWTKEQEERHAAPDAPFKTTWPELAFKRVLRFAAENDYDSIAWTTGDQQNRRYGLERFISRVELNDNSSGGIGNANLEGPFEVGLLNIYNKKGEKIVSRHMGEEELRQTLGNELTDKLLAVAPTQVRSAGIGMRQRKLEGLDVAIGGDGMRGFYDQILPATAAKLTKKWGGKVGTLTLPKMNAEVILTREYVVETLQDYQNGGIDEDGVRENLGIEIADSALEAILVSDPQRSKERRQARDALATSIMQMSGGQRRMTVHALNVTPEMRQAAIDGLPLFHTQDMAERQDAILQGEQGEGEASRTWNYVVFKAQDRFNDVLRLQNEAKKYRDDMAVPEQLDTYMRETLYHGRTEFRFEQYDKDYVQPLLKAIKASGYTYEQVEEFLYARHAPEANEYIRKITEKHPDLFEGSKDEWHSGMTDAQAAEAMARLRKAGDFAKLEAIGARVDQMTKFERDIMVSEGLVSAAEVGAWEARFKHYIPLKGWQDAPEAGRLLGRGKGFDTGGKVVKNRTGRKSRAGNILATLVGQTQVTMIKAEKAKVGRAFLEFAKTHPSSLYEVNQVETERYLDTGTMTVKERPVFRGGQKADNFLNVKVDGRDEWIEFAEDNPQAQRIVRAFRNLSSKEMNGLNTFLLGVNRYLATVNTSLNPEFVISNLLRDLQTAMVNVNATDAKDLKLRILRDWRKAFGGIMSGEFGKGQKEWARHFEDFKRAGAKTGWIDFTASPKDLEAQLRDQIEGGVVNVGKHGIQAVLGVVNKVNLGVENAIRLSVFVNARQMGMSEDKAAELAKNLTVNFNRKGDWGTEINAWYLFYNAAAQGTAVLWNAAKNKHARRVMYGIVALGIAMPIINRIVGGDDEDGENRYDKIPEWERSSNFIIMLPKAWRWKLESGDEVDHIKIPLPYGYNVLYYTGTQLGDVLDYNAIGNKHELNGADMAMQWMSEFVGAFNPMGSAGSLWQTLAPTILDPFIALSENKNWFGGRIYPEASQFDVRPPDSELYYRNASDVSKLVAHTANQMFGGSEVTPNKFGMDFSPNSLDYLADFAFGGLGRFVENTGRTVLNATLSPEKLDIGQMPFARRVLGQTGDRYIADTYFERAEQVRYLEKERDAMQQLDVGTPARTKKEQYIESNYGTAERLYTEYKATDGRIGRLRKEKRALQEQKGQVEDKPRQERIRQIDQEIQDEMQQFNTQWNLIEDAKRTPSDTRGIFGRIQPEIGGKTKPEAVASLRKAGLPAMAALMDAMPFRPRAAMFEKYRKELGDG